MDLIRLQVWHQKFTKPMHIKTGDTVTVITGKDKGREGKVLRVYRKMGMVLVENINMYKKNVKKSEEYPQGGIVDIPRPLHISNISLSTDKQKGKKKQTKK